MTDAHARNRSTFAAPAVVASYAGLTGLTPCEQTVFERHVPPGADVLDLGVGTGRTTPHLSQVARRYVALDYSSSMIAEARRVHPDIDFVIGEASDLSSFVSGSFDAVVFSFNGIDYLHPDGARHRCLAEVRRVLRPRGAFVFSTHNPRALIARPPEERAVRRLAIAGYATVRRASRLIRTEAFRRGDGYVFDPAQGGLITHAATRRHTIRETEAAGFQHRETRGSDFPRRSATLWTPWWYYAFTRL
jgi:ubiquinone/menaquinone biosynthesis C-methylase UbiE